MTRSPFDYAFDPPLARRSPWLMAVLLTLAAVAVGYAIHLRDGEYTYRGMSLIQAVHWVGIGIALTLLGTLLAGAREPAWGERAVVAVLAAAVMLQFALLFTSQPQGWNWWSDDLRDKRPENLRLFWAGLTTAAVLSAGLVLRLPAVRQVCVPLVLVVHLLLGAWMVRSSPQPHIDVFAFQQEAAAALLRGENPYAVEMPDVYAAEKQQSGREVYGKGISKDGRLRFGYPYLPVSLFMALPGYAAAGDYRYAQVFAMTLAGAFLAYARPGRIAALAAVLLLFTPRAFFVLGRGWTEPFQVCLLAFTVFCACRGLRVLPLALGLLMASKQYMAFAVPAVLVLAASLGGRGRAWRLCWQAALVALIVTLPLVLWDGRSPTGEAESFLERRLSALRTFWYSAVTVQKEAPFRDDALSYLVMIKQATGRQPRLIVAFIAMFIGMAIAAWRAPRSVAGFAAVLALTFLPFIAFNKQAFANYYYFTIGCLCCAVAAVRETSAEPEDVFSAPAPAPAGPSPYA